MTIYVWTDGTPSIVSDQDIIAVFVRQFDEGRWIMNTEIGEIAFVDLINRLIELNRYFRLHFTMSGLIIEPTPDHGAA